MAHIAGVDVPDKKQVVISLTYIFGVGRSTSAKILKKLGIDGTTKVQDLTDDEKKLIRKEIEDDDSLAVEGELRTIKKLEMNRLLDIGCYRGYRHRKGLPVRGQRTKCNARTRKGKKKR